MTKENATETGTVVVPVPYFEDAMASAFENRPSEHAPAPVDLADQMARTALVLEHVTDETAKNLLITTMGNLLALQNAEVFGRMLEIAKRHGIALGSNGLPLAQPDTVHAPAETTTAPNVIKGPWASPAPEVTDE